MLRELTSIANGQVPQVQHHMNKKHVRAQAIDTGPCTGECTTRAVEVDLQAILDDGLRQFLCEKLAANFVAAMEDARREADDGGWEDKAGGWAWVDTEAALQTACEAWSRPSGGGDSDESRHVDIVLDSCS